MQIITLDFETYYDPDYSLSKMTTQEYIQDKRFQIIGMGIKVNDGKTRWFEGWQEGFRVLRAAAEHDECVLVAHNALFDYSILTEQLPLFKPARVVCTMSMARSLGLDGQAHGASLAKLATYLQAQGLPIPNKGDEVVRALGKRLTDFTQEELDAYGEYCKTDVDICYQAFTAMYPMLPKAELAWQDLVIRMHAEPKLRLDRDVLKADLVRVQERQAKLLDRVQDTLGVASHEEALKTLRSNDKFAEVLRGYGVTPPTKVSATTGKTTYAFAKTDKEMTDLLESDNADVQDVVTARLGTKSSIEQTRIEKFIQLSYLPRLSIPLMVSGAHTHRLSGCLTADTKVWRCTPQGEKECVYITDVQPSDLVWDGEEWVAHDGVQFSGIKEVITHDGITGTFDHQVYTSEDATLGLFEAYVTATPIMDCPEPSDR